MDPFTQRLMDRARARREVLEKKMSEQAAPRKRPVPLGEHNETVTDSNSSFSQDDDSPKRQCVRTTEQQVKQDTPAIPSVKARRGVLRSALGDMESDDYVPPLRKRHEMLQAPENTPPDPAPVAASRRNRFAALANTINNWEDDLTHVSSTKAEESSKKTWQPPKTAAPEKSTQQKRPTDSVTDGPSKPLRTFAHQAQDDIGSEPKKTVVSSLTITMGSPDRSAIEIVPGKTTAVSPALQVAMIDIVSGTTTAVSPSVKKIGGSSTNLNRSPQPFRRHGVTSGSSIKHVSATPISASTRSPVKSMKSAGILRSEMGKSEPTARPVSARMAAWQEKTAGPVVDNEPTKLPVAGRKGLWEQKISDAERERKPTSPIKPGMRAAPKAPRPHTGVVMRVKSGRGVGQEPTEETVHNRMSMWEKRVSQNTESSDKPPRPLSTAAFAVSTAQRATEIRDQHKSPTKAAVSSVMSPEKVGQATKTLADRLTDMQNGWQNNEIAEKIKHQKDEELAMLRNRWKNGIPSENEPENTDAKCVAPPLPVNQLKSSPNKETPKPVMRDIHRQKVRNDGNESLGNISEPAGPENFECKLRAMGFDVTSEGERKVAVADLAPIKRREQETKAVAAPSPKVATMQLKVLNVEDTRTTTTTFGETKVTMKVKCNENAGSTPGHQSGKTSIYQLIKNKAVTTPARVNPAAKLQYDDSFDSGDSFTGEEDNGGYSAEEYVYEEGGRQERYRRHSSRDEPATAGTLQSATSQESVSSETSEYSEYTETEETEGTEDYTEEEGDYSNEEEESDEGDEAGNVDDLLNEVMDDTVMTETDTTEGDSDLPVPAPRTSIHKPHESQPRTQRTPSSSSTQDDFRVPSGQPPRRCDNRVTFSHDVRGGMSSSQCTSTTSSASASSSASESEDERAYTIDRYRKSNRNRPCSVPSMTIVRQSEHTKRMSVPEEPLPFIPEKSVRQQLRDLQASVNQEQSVIQQTSNALNQCCGANSNFANSVEAVECHRLLLVACKKREGYLAEMERLRTEQPKDMAGPQGSLTISDIRLPLKKDFVQKIGSLADTVQHFFICLLRNGSHTIVSQMVSTHDAMVRDTLDIPNMFKLCDIAQDFNFNLEVYSMSINREQEALTPKKKQKSQTPKKGLFGHLKPSTPRSMQSPGGPNVVRTTTFMQIANLPITIKSINKTHFTLDRVPYTSPLQGTIHVRLQCLMESAVEERGFLTMFEDVGGFGAWHRRWCVLRSNTLSYWKYPDDEHIKEPIGYVDLKACITDNVGLIPRDICARPNTFELVTVRRQHRGDSNTLVTRCANTMTTTRHQLSADTKEDRVVWCDALNKALTTLRAWNSDAMRPIKMQ